MLFLLLPTLNPSGADIGRDVLIQQTPKAALLLTEGHGSKITDRTSRGLDPNEISCFFHTRTGTYSSSRTFTFQPCCYFILRLQRHGPVKGTPDSALLFKKKGAQREEQAQKGEGRGREGRGRRRRRRGRSEARSWSFSCCPLRLSHFTLPMHF